MKQATSNVPLESEARIRAALPCTWHAFFARFPHLRDVQKASILPILRGESIIVNAPTASGKTEAIVAPVIERYLKNRIRNQVSATQADKPLKSSKKGKAGHVDIGVGPAILMVAPTKALCNDLYRRLAKPVQNVGLEIAVRTGDAPSFNVEKPPAFVITTPESLDSLIARKPASFIYLQSIIIDEIHLIYANGRGDQLQCLLSRLKLLNKTRVQICASSATVPEIEQIAHNFLGDDGKMVACTSGTREIVATIMNIADDPQLAIDETVKIIESMLLESPTRKLIAFCNSRSNVENIVHGLRQNPRIASLVFAHHGSLSKEERLRTEKQFLMARNAACVATSTLELGIDIGDVDRIVLLGPPPDVSSLIQRIGRGSRLLNYSQVCCLANSVFNAHRFMHLVECARQELLFPDPVTFRPTTIVQQALSICLQNPECWIGKKALYDRLPQAAHDYFSLEDCGDVLESMTNGGMLRKVDRGRYVPESKTQFLFNRGYMHSMIADRPETDVVDAVTGRTLGSVYLKQSSKNAIQTGTGVSLTLAGNAHTVSYMKDQKLFVKRGTESSELGFLALEPPRYSLGLARSFAKYMHIPEQAFYIKCIPATLDVVSEFNPKLGDLLCPEVALSPKDVPPGSEYLVIHFMGTIGSMLLQHFFEKQGYALKKASRTPFFLRLTAKPALTAFPDEETLFTQFQMYVHANVSSFAKLLQPGPWLNFIPETFVLRWLLHSIDIKAYARTLANLPIYLI
ncbi:MAG: DEAD/DEAH box helicase [Proteobacteria bacterium]|nr:DEAD/DEAH box helicase [Pseudomonadota bacterium]